MAVDSSDFGVPETGQPFDGNHPLPLFAPTVTAFLGRTQRGPVNEPVLLRSSDDFRRIFGTHCTFSALSHAVQHYFLHGGQAAVVVRLVNRARRASVELRAGPQSLRVEARNPGSQELLRISVDYDRVLNRPSRFNLVVQRVGRLGSKLVEDQELFPALSIDPAETPFVGDALKDSELIRLAGPLPAHRPDATCANHPGHPIPYVSLTSSGSDGEELSDYDLIGSNEERTGLFALERVERVDLVCMPPAPGRDLGSVTFLAAERYCERRKALLIWDPPWSWRTADTALIGVRGSSFGSPNALGCFPRITSRETSVRHPDGLPACGVVAGLLAARDREGIWQPMPAADNLLKANLVPLAEVTDREAAMLARAGINAFRRVRAATFGLSGNATLAGPHGVASLWQRLDRRRLALFILGAVERCAGRALRGAREPGEVEEALLRQVRTFLQALYGQGALPGDRREQAFFVRAAHRQDRTEPVLLRFGFALEEPNAFLIYEIVRAPGGVLARAVPPLEAAQLAG